MLHDLEQALNWLAWLEVRVPATRVAVYQAIIRSLIDALKRNQLQAFTRDDKFREVSNSFYEASQLIAIHKGLVSVPVTLGLKSRLQSLVHGQTSSVAERADGKSHKPRDASFELFVASAFTRAGFLVDLDQITDVVAASGANTFLIECKRPRHENSFESAMKEASSQLNRRLSARAGNPTCFGLIAASVDLVLHGKQDLLQIPTQAILYAGLKRSFTKLISDHGSSWQKPKHPQIIGALLFIQGPVIFVDEQILTRFDYLAGNSIVPLSSASGQVFVSVLKQVGDAVFRTEGGSLSEQ
jgi:hypothetical protein